MRVQSNTDRTLIGVRCRRPVAQPARQDSCALRCRKNWQIQLPALHPTSPFPKSHENAFSADSSTASAILCKQPASILHQDSKTTPTNTLRLDQTCGSATRKGLRDVKSLHLHSHLCGERFIGLSRPTASRKVLNKYLVDKTK
jgi:hypothetical protein